MGRFSKTATIPFSPRLTPSTMNWFESTVLPEPEGPATSTEYPCGMPPSISSSRPGTPVLRRCLSGWSVMISSGLRMRGKTLKPASVMRAVCSPGICPWPRIFITCSLRTTELRSIGLVEPEQPVGHREHRAVVLTLAVLPEEEGGGLVARERQREALHEVRQLHLAGSVRPSVLRTMARKESTTTMRRVRPLELLHDGLQHLRHPAVERLLTEVDEANRAVADLGGVEEGVLLLIAKHLDGRLADDAEVHGLSLGARVREHDLVAERRLAAPRAAGDQVEGELRNPAAQHLVEARHAGGQFANRNAVAHFGVSVGAVSSIVGQALRRTWTVNRSPMKVRDELEEGSEQGGGRLGRGGGVERLQRTRASFVEPFGRCNLGERNRELALRQLRATRRTALERLRSPRSGAKVSVELVVDSPGRRRALRPSCCLRSPRT